jgi:phytoene dehydrogenase-like protein
LTHKYYDVAVLGRSLGALAAAALLARRDFRVLVLGQGARASSYRLGQYVLRRGAFSMLFAASPTWKRILLELAQSQTFRRRAVALDPMVQILLPGQRIELPTDMRLFEREIEREFPGVRRVLEDLFVELARVNAAADETFERDAVWPPGTFWERRRASRYTSALPYAREPGLDLLADLPPAHPYRQLAVALVGFAAQIRLDRLPSFAFARLLGAWTRGLYALPRGQDELSEFLLERIEAHGGTSRLSERATELLVDHGGVRSILIDGEASPTSVGFVVTDGTGEDLASLSRGHGIRKAANREWPKVTPAFGRFVLSAVVRSEGLPERLARESIVVSQSEGLPLHVVRLCPADEPDAPAEARGQTSLVVEALLPARAEVATVRERILAALEEAFPFIGRHLIVVDSPHDGRPVWVYDPPERDSDGRAQAARHDVDRIELSGGSAAAEPMVCHWDVDPPGYLGLSGEPVRGPIERTFLVGATVLPALGQEGELLAAWGAARIITRTDRHKERIRRAMWSKVEIG